MTVEIHGQTDSDTTSPRTWRWRTEDQLKTWTTTIKADLETLTGPRFFGYARRGKGWVKVPSELAEDHRAWVAFIQSVINSISGTSSTRPDEFCQKYK